MRPRLSRKTQPLERTPPPTAREMLHGPEHLSAERREGVSAAAWLVEQRNADRDRRFEAEREAHSRAVRAREDEIWQAHEARMKRRVV